MITLEMLENAVGIEYLIGTDYLALQAEAQDVILASYNQINQPHANSIVNLWDKWFDGAETQMNSAYTLVSCTQPLNSFESLANVVFAGQNENLNLSSLFVISSELYMFWDPVAL